VEGAGPFVQQVAEALVHVAPFVDVDDEFQAAAGGPPRSQGIVTGHGERVVYQDLTLSVHSA
jgi:hypothetical protein